MERHYFITVSRDTCQSDFNYPVSNCFTENWERLVGFLRRFYFKYLLVYLIHVKVIYLNVF